MELYAPYVLQLWRDVHHVIPVNNVLYVSQVITPIYKIHVLSVQSQIAQYV